VKCPAASLDQEKVEMMYDHQQAEVEIGEPEIDRERVELEIVLALCHLVEEGPERHRMVQREVEEQLPLHQLVRAVGVARTLSTCLDLIDSLRIYPR
jgi:hypothetical protein